MIEACSVRVNGVRLNVLRGGSGPPLLLLHGWPEFAAAWTPLMERLAGGFTLLAPDFRGFGDSDNPHPEPTDVVTADLLADDMAGVIETMAGDGPVGIVAHDVGSSVAQAIARKRPALIAGLFLFDCVYPGIGSRMGAPDHLAEIWYQSFHQKPWAAAFVGQSRDSIRLYIGAFLRHWAGRPDAFTAEDVERWTDNFAKPGNLQGGFNWYIGANKGRLAMIRGDAPTPPPIAIPTRVLWGGRDPVLKAEWRDRLPEFFSDVEIAVAETAGHFVHHEEPDLAAREIRQFFGRLPGF